MNKDELLYHYFSNSLTQAQEELFQNLLKTDPEFKAQFDFENNVKRVTKEKRHLDLKAKLGSFESDIKKKNIPIAKFNFSLWKIAASVALLIIAGWFGYNSFFGVDYENLYSENYTKYPNTVVPILKGPDAVITTEIKAFQAYESNDDLNAILFFKELKAQKNPKYIDFYLAQSYLGSNQIEKAITHFSTVIEMNQEFSEKAKWYLALTYLKNSDILKATEQLKEIISEEAYKAQEAKELLKAIN